MRRRLVLNFIGSASHRSGWLSAVLMLILAISAAGSAWTDRSEYDLVLTIRSESTPQKRIELLDQWKLKYPKTELRQERRELYLATYQALKDEVQMFAVAQEMLSDQPNNPVGIYWYTVLLPEAKNPTPELLDKGDKAATQLLSSLDIYFGANKKPASVQEDAWKKQRIGVESLAHRTLGWIAWQRGNYAVAEGEFAKVLEQDPKNAEISAWMGIISGLQTNRRSPELWYLARATALRDDGALPDDTRRRLHALLENIYAAYHGDTEGLDQLRSAAEKSVAPPADFKVESAAVIAARRNEDEVSLTDPELGAWLRIRRQLEAADGDKYFAETLRTAPLPKLKGTVLRCIPANRPQEVVIGLKDPVAEEVVLKVNAPFHNEAKPGTTLEFEGLADSFQRQPFMLTILVDQDKITGWPRPGSHARTSK